jgi:hypothetical protein
MRANPIVICGISFQDAVQMSLAKHDLTPCRSRVGRRDRGEGYYLLLRKRAILTTGDSLQYMLAIYNR